MGSRWSHKSRHTIYLFKHSFINIVFLLFSVRNVPLGYMTCLKTKLLEEVIVLLFFFSNQHIGFKFSKRTKHKPMGPISAPYQQALQFFVNIALNLCRDAKPTLFPPSCMSQSVRFTPNATWESEASRQVTG